MGSVGQPATIGMARHDPEAVAGGCDEGSGRVNGGDCGERHRWPMEAVDGGSGRWMQSTVVAAGGGQWRRWVEATDEGGYSKKRRKQLLPAKV